MMGLPRCSTVVLHPQNTAVRETPDFEGLFRHRKSVAEREGFEPPIGLHLCRISSAVHSTTLPPLQAPWRVIPHPRSGRVLGEDGGADKARSQDSRWARQAKRSQKMEHLTVSANGAALHVARTGQGRPLLLLHGWPEFWLTWEPVMARLADRFTLYAPDLRGFGDSDKPDGPFGPDQHAADMLALMDALGLRQAGIIGHDVGGALMQPL